MHSEEPFDSPGFDLENQEWLESLEYIYQHEGPERVRTILQLLQIRAQNYGVTFTCPSTTPYINTIPYKDQPPYPGSREIERRIKSLVRWNAMAMVVRANRELNGIGGHISTYASAATLYEVAFNHFFRGRTKQFPGDVVYFQGHASPGIYARAFLEGRLTERDLLNFRRELCPKGGGLPSYPHPWLMPNFWQFPTVSMGLGPLLAIYQAFFNRYLQDRGLIGRSDQRVWAFLGDGEMDEPESMGAITLAARERLDNLTFVINCNLQRLDGPVRGNGKVIQELEAAFRGAGWHVIKVIWGDDWDSLIDADDGTLVRVMGEVVDGDYQKYSVETGAYIREHFFGRDPKLLKLVEHLSDEQLQKLRRGGHDPEKVYAAYKKAVEHKGAPTVILAQTIKGYGLGEAGEGKNITHQQKKLNEDELKVFRTRFGIPLSDDDVIKAPFYKPPEKSEEIKYLMARRKALGGFLPYRSDKVPALKKPDDTLFNEFYEGSGNREMATTMIFVHLLSKLLRDKSIGKRIVPIVPDEARTFGMESLFRQVGIYSHVGQKYDPVDRDSLLYYKETSDGAILEQGINEAGSLASFIAAGTSYATHGVHMIPFFIFYSMFGLQRVGDLVWLAGDIRARGFLLGGTSGRTTLAGEGLQHQDGNSHVQSMVIPNLMAYDPAYSYELAVIVKEGIRRMFVKGESLFYYITVMNETYVHPPMPEGVEAAILKGIYRFHKSKKRGRVKANLMGSGTLLNEAVKAGRILENKYRIPADIWSVTSYKSLYQNGMDTDRWNLLHPDKPRRKTTIEEALGQSKGVFVAATDYVKALPASVAKWIPGPYLTLGTDGYGRSAGREELRDFFEVDARYMVLGALMLLASSGEIDQSIVSLAIVDLDLDPGKMNPIYS
jgi:pyruvate dehydrogenase E1 component